MNLTLGCKERVEDEWIYILRNGTSMTQKEWTERVNSHIRDNKNQLVLESIKKKVGNRSWFKMDTPEDFALQMYAAKYCTNVENKHQEVQKSQQRVTTQRKEEFGQISLM